jgi:hypothetical protein
VLHGDIAQAQRETTFQAFRDGKFKVLVATDVASRGLDIPEIDLVVMCHPTKDVDTYVHRSGRTGRAGRSGVAVTFYTPRELGLLRNIERRIKQKMKQISAPQPADVIKANARDIKLSVEAVHDEVIGLFQETAEEMIQEMGAERALCAALAVISGQTDPLPARSMLTSLDGFKTFILRVESGAVPAWPAHFPSPPAAAPRDCRQAAAGLPVGCSEAQNKVFELAAPHRGPRNVRPPGNTRCLRLDPKGASANVRVKHEGTASFPAGGTR